MVRKSNFIVSMVGNKKIRSVFQKRKITISLLVFFHVFWMASVYIDRYILKKVSVSSCFISTKRQGKKNNVKQSLIYTDHFDF